MNLTTKNKYVHIPIKGINRRWVISFLLITLCGICSIWAQTKSTIDLRAQSYKLDSRKADVNSETVVIVTDDRLESKQSITLKKGISEAVNGERQVADMIFTVNVRQAGHYLIHTYAVTDEEGAALMKKAKTKFESLFMRMQIGENRATKRVVYVPWNRPKQQTGIFYLDSGEQDIRVWLPRGVRLEYMEIQPYVPPRVPQAAADYEPRVKPPASRPRLWVNAESLPLVRENLLKDENRTTWEKLKKEAIVPFGFSFNSEEEISYNVDLEKAVEKKAFYYLMTGEKEIGREAIDLTVSYLANVEFGNLLDITRERGRAIYTASLVYDWTYDLLTTAEKETMIKNLMRLAMDMEI